MKKKLLTAVLVLTLALGLSACGPGTAEATPTPTATPEPTQTVEPTPAPTPEEKVTAGQMFRSVLLGEKAFVDAASQKSILIGQIAEMISPEVPFVVDDSFQVVDMDGDGTEEVILGISIEATIGGEPYLNSYGPLVLRYQDGVVYGFTFYDRQMSEIREDGSFYQSSGGMGGMARITFDKETYEINKYSYMDTKVTGDTETLMYYVDYKEATYDEWWAAFEEWKKLDYATACDYNEENINAVGLAPAPASSPAPEPTWPPRTVNAPVRSINTSGECCSIVLEDGSVLFYGGDGSGDLGNGFCAMGGLEQSTDAAAAWAMRFCGLALDEDGRLWSFGYTPWLASEYSADPVVVLDHVETAAMTTRFCAAVRDDNSLWVWWSTIEGAEHEPTQVWENAAQVHCIWSEWLETGEEERHLYVTTTEGELWELWGFYGEKVQAKQMMDHVTWASANYVLTEDGQLCGLAGGEVLLSNVERAHDNGVTAAAVTADGELYAWDPEGGPLEHQVLPYTTPTRLMDGVKQAVAMPQALVLLLESGDLVELLYQDIPGAADIRVACRVVLVMA